MIDTKSGAERRLKRLERVLVGRRARVERLLAERRRAGSAIGPIGGLQRYGYPLALLLALAAVLPTVVGFGWRRRRLLSGAVVNSVAIHSLRKRLDAARPTGSDW